MHHFNRPKISNNSLIRDQKSNKHIANGCKKLVHTFKREAVQFFCGKKPCRKSLTAGSPSGGSNVNWLQTWPQGRGHVTFWGLRFPVSHEKPDAKGPYCSWSNRLLVLIFIATNNNIRKYVIWPPTLSSSVSYFNLIPNTKGSVPAHIQAPSCGLRKRGTFECFKLTLKYPDIRWSTFFIVWSDFSSDQLFLKIIKTKVC